MKQTTLILAFILWTVLGSASCTFSGLYFWPSEKVVKQNSIIVITGYASDQNVILNLNKKFPVYLKSGEKIVNLVVKETLVGEFHLTQALLTLEKELEEGLEYQLFIDSLPNFERRITRWNSVTKKHEPIFWQVEKGIDTDNPVWKQKPSIVKKTIEQYGCGPAAFVHFTFQTLDSSEILIRTTVKNLKSGNTTTFYIEPDENVFLVGHNMCSGAFTFKDGYEYEVFFEIMDASGNITIWSDDKVRFTRPYNSSINY